MKLVDVMLIGVVVNLTMAAIDIALGLTLDTQFAWVLLLIVLLPLYGAFYCLRTWLRCR